MNKENRKKNFFKEEKKNEIEIQRKMIVCCGKVIHAIYQESISQEEMTQSTKAIANAQGAQ